MGIFKDIFSFSSTEDVQKPSFLQKEKDQKKKEEKSVKQSVNFELLNKRIDGVVEFCRTFQTDYVTKIYIESLEKKVVELENKVKELSSVPKQSSNNNSNTVVETKNQQHENSKHQPKIVQEQPQTYFIRSTSQEGNITICEKLEKSDACYEFCIEGKNGTLNPLADQSSYLIMQTKYMLEPLFTIEKKGNTTIQTQKGACYQLEGEVWKLKSKGTIKII